ncbi:MAG: molybdopterin converting factor [Pirellulales bacterium]|nr:molybdopterin converting factor [Pirellulales bacterium]
MSRDLLAALVNTENDERTHMQVLVINNDGAGFADYLEVDDGTTVEQLFEKQIPAAKPQSYLIRVNRQPVAADQVLREGDRISITPSKIEGAH